MRCCPKPDSRLLLVSAKQSRAYHHQSTNLTDIEKLKKADKEEDSKALITGIANELNLQECKFYTCHCTENKAYQIMKNEMNDKLEYLSAGMVVEL